MIEKTNNDLNHSSAIFQVFYKSLLIIKLILIKIILEYHVSIPIASTQRQKICKK